MRNFLLVAAGIAFAGVCGAAESPKQEPLPPAAEQSADAAKTPAAAPPQKGKPPKDLIFQPPPVPGFMLKKPEKPLTMEEMAAIAKIDRNCRLIKGQVFLWREGQSWEDLWDLNGKIAR